MLADAAQQGYAVDTFGSRCTSECYLHTILTNNVQLMGKNEIYFGHGLGMFILKRNAPQAMVQNFRNTILTLQKIYELEFVYVY